MDKQTFIKICCIAIILLLIALIIEKRNPITTLPMGYEVNGTTEKSSELISSKEVTIYVTDFNGLTFPLRVEVSGVKSQYKDDIELTFSMLTEYSNYLPLAVKTVIPPSTELIDYEIIDRNLILNVSMEFMNYNKKELIQLKEILTYTFTEMNNIDTVSILCDNQRVSDGNESMTRLSRQNTIINTVFKADDLYNSRTITVFYYTTLTEQYYLVPINMVVDAKDITEEEFVKDILSSYYINIPVTSFINEENIISVDSQLSNMKSGYTNIEDDFSLKQYYYTLVANDIDLEVGQNEVHYNKYSVRLK